MIKFNFTSRTLAYCWCLSCWVCGINSEQVREGYKVETSWRGQPAAVHVELLFLPTPWALWHILLERSVSMKWMALIKCVCLLLLTCGKSIQRILTYFYYSRNCDSTDQLIEAIQMCNWTKSLPVFDGHLSLRMSSVESKYIQIRKFMFIIKFNGDVHLWGSVTRMKPQRV